MDHCQSSEETVLDFAALEARCLGNAALVQRVLAKFTKQLEEDLQHFERAVRKQDFCQAADLAHRIKGTAGSVEARRLYDDVTQAEQLAFESRSGELVEWLDKLRGDRLELIAIIGRRNRLAATPAMPH